MTEEKEPEKVRLYGDVTPRHEADFMLIKGVFRCRNNGDALERMIELVVPTARKLATKKSGS